MKITSQIEKRLAVETNVMSDLDYYFDTPLNLLL